MKKRLKDSPGPQETARNVTATGTFKRFDF
jgi:hypothetical protein